MRLFRNRTYGQVFPALAALVVLLSVTAGPQLVEPSSLSRVLTAGIGAGTIGSAVLFLVLKVLDWRAGQSAARPIRTMSLPQKSEADPIPPKLPVGLPDSATTVVAGRSKPPPARETGIIRWKAPPRPAATRSDGGRPVQPAGQGGPKSALRRDPLGGLTDWPRLTGQRLPPVLARPASTRVG